MRLVIYTDGGSRGNPGPAASGVVMKNEQGKTIEAFGTFLGEQTNNFAEYTAAIEGLQHAIALGADEVELIADSKLVVEQLNGNWKVKEPSIQKLFVKAYNEMQKIKRVTIRHTLRSGNKEADAEVNRVLDAQAES